MINEVANQYHLFFFHWTQSGSPFHLRCHRQSGSSERPSVKTREFFSWSLAVWTLQLSAFVGSAEEMGQGKGTWTWTWGTGIEWHFQLRALCATTPLSPPWALWPWTPDCHQHSSLFLHFWCFIQHSEWRSWMPRCETMIVCIHSLLWEVQAHHYRLVLHGKKYISEAIIK